MTDWLSQLWDTLTSVSVPLLVLGLAFQTAQTAFVALAWRNILRASYPEGGVTYRTTLGYYAGGNGLNAILPASAGTVAMLGLFRTSIAGSTVAGLVGATVVENIFFAHRRSARVPLALPGRGGIVRREARAGSPTTGCLTAIILVVGGILIGPSSGRSCGGACEQTWKKAKEGGVIVTMPRKFLVQVVGVEAVSYIARMGVNATFMYAYDIPVSLTNIFLIVAAASISSTVAIAPGAVGAQTALASVVLKGVAPQATITAYTIGQALITTAWNAVFGLTMLARTIGWKQTRKLIHRRKKDEERGGCGRGDGPRRAHRGRRRSCAQPGTPGAHALGGGAHPEGPAVIGRLLAWWALQHRGLGVAVLLVGSVTVTGFAGLALAGPGARAAERLPEADPQRSSAPRCTSSRSGSACSS